MAVLACGGGDADPFRIGVMESLTGLGETYGTVASQAKQMAADEINAAGGIHGRMLELIVEDSQCSAKDAIAAYNKLTDVDGVKIILGTSCSSAMLGAAPLAEADGVILFSGLASNPDIANAGDYIFRTQISDIQVGIDTGNVLWADGVRKLATITETTDYAEGVRRTSVAQFQKRGGRVVAEERYPSDAIDFRSQLGKLFEADPDALHLAPQSEFAAGAIIKQAREVGYQGPIYAETVSVGTTALEVAVGLESMESLEYILAFGFGNSGPGIGDEESGAVFSIFKPYRHRPAGRRVLDRIVHQVRHRLRKQILVSQKPAQCDRLTVKCDTFLGRYRPIEFHYVHRDMRKVHLFEIATAGACLDLRDA